MLVACVLGWLSMGVVHAAQNPSLVVDRTAVERVYYAHRLGTKPPFEQLLPASSIEQLVRQDLHKQAVLQRVYRLEATPALVEAEAQRIHRTTRAPEVLAELEAALDNDPNRFARTVARPIVVDRLLRERFDNDDNLHASQRQQAEAARKELLAAKKGGAGCEQLLARLREGYSNALTQTTWQLTSRPAETTGAERSGQVEVNLRFGPDARVLSPPHTELKRKVYLEELPGELQQVLRVQLGHAGDVSAVIETSAGFLLYLATEKTDKELSVATLAFPKRSYEQWIAEQSEAQP
jgi:hypothetical protein